MLFGGAAGGGKSYGQLMDALIYALRYPKSKQLMLRRTYPELEKSLVRVSQEIFPQEIYSYNGAKHVGKFKNGSVLDFGYCDSESDVYRYQSAEYDVIRFDELTHFTEQMYLYLMSRLRGANPFPKSMRSTTNPGGVGHGWVKARFIDPSPPEEIFDGNPGKRLFIPAGVRDNRFLLEADPGYIQRLRSLHERDRRALLYGDWNVFEGQFFTEWREETHVCAPFEIPSGWRRYFAMDYGLDMLACYWFAVDETGRAWCYRELKQKDLVVSDAARMILENTGINEHIDITFAPPDLWSRTKDSGKSMAELFMTNGVALVKASNNRVQGWLQMKEFLKDSPDGKPGLMFFRNCKGIIEDIQAIQADEKNPNDCAKEPHDVTHSNDAIRYFCVSRSLPGEPEKAVADETDDEPAEDYENTMTGGAATADYIGY